jgi:hypothetical protein
MPVSSPMGRSTTLPRMRSATDTQARGLRPFTWTTRLAHFSCGAGCGSLGGKFQALVVRFRRRLSLTRTRRTRTTDTRVSVTTRSISGRRIRGDLPGIGAWAVVGGALLSFQGEADVE